MNKIVYRNHKNLIGKFVDDDLVERVWANGECNGTFWGKVNWYEPHFQIISSEEYNFYKVLWMKKIDTSTTLGKIVEDLSKQVDEDKDSIKMLTEELASERKIKANLANALDKIEKEVKRLHEIIERKSILIADRDALYEALLRDYNALKNPPKVNKDEKLPEGRTIPEVNARLTVGTKLYYVCAYGERTEVKSYTVTTAPYLNFRVCKTGWWWIGVKNDEHGYINEQSMTDMGLIPNDYNNHNTFFSHEEAIVYRNRCIKENIMPTKSFCSWK